MCKLCEINPVYQFTNKRKLCKSCFIRYFQKKFFYTIRKFGMIRQRDILYYETKNFRDFVVKEILEIFARKTDISFTNNKNKATKVAVSDTIDSEAKEIIDTLINKNSEKLKNLKPVEDKKIIKPLYLFLDEEVLLYAKLRGLKFNNREEKRNDISDFLNKLEQKHPEVKRAVVNSYLKINLL